MVAITFRGSDTTAIRIRMVRAWLTACAPILTNLACKVRNSQVPIDPGRVWRCRAVEKLQHP